MKNAAIEAMERTISAARFSAEAIKGFDNKVYQEQMVIIEQLEKQLTKRRIKLQENAE